MARPAAGYSAPLWRQPTVHGVIREDHRAQQAHCSFPVSKPSAGRGGREDGGDGLTARGCECTAAAFSLTTRGPRTRLLEEAEELIVTASTVQMWKGLTFSPPELRSHEGQRCVRRSDLSRCTSVFGGGSVPFPAAGNPASTSGSSADHCYRPSRRLRAGSVDALLYHTEISGTV
ncbi:unnamed protein product [Sphagnum compactum]